MKINRYKLKNNVTTENLTSLGFNPGGTWVKDDAVLFYSRVFKYKPLHFEYSINIAFSSNINDWNDFDNILILDEAFCQPYTPFYGDNYGKEVDDFPALENVVENYNTLMNSLNIFEKVETNE